MRNPMTQVRIFEDLQAAETLWGRHCPQRVLFDLWPVRASFQKEFNRPPFFLVATRGGRFCGMLALSWIEESRCFGHFPGEVWDRKKPGWNRTGSFPPTPRRPMPCWSRFQRARSTFATWFPNTASRQPRLRKSTRSGTCFTHGTTNTVFPHTFKRFRENRGRKCDGSRSASRSRVFRSAMTILAISTICST